MSFYLRHHPDQLGLDLDEDGYTTITVEELAEKLNTTASTINKIVKNDEKERFRIRNNRIRANYGHSIKLGKKIYTENTEELSSDDLPTYLYHGTKSSVLPSIQKDGLKSRGRQFVHLSFTTDWAKRVGNRKQGITKIIRIDARKAQEEGVKFWKAGPTTILATEIPPQHLEILS